MKRKLLSFIGCILLGVGCYAQNTAVSATVVDGDSIAWAAATWKVDFRPSTQFPNPAQYTLNGSVLANSVLHQNGVADSNGALSFTVYDSSQISPTGSGWTLTVCSNTSAPCSVYNFATAGGSMNISSPLATAISTPRFPCNGNCFGYSTVEIYPIPATGTIFYNTSPGTSQTCNQWNGSTWSSCGGGGSNNGTVNISVGPNCPSNSSTCIKIFQDTQYVIDATSNSTAVITCPDCAFTQADVGKVAWATTQGTGGGIGFLLYTTIVCPQTTISSVTNSTTVVLNNACTASGSGNVVFIWGHDDGPTLAGLDSVIGCNVVHFSTGNTFIMTGKGFFNNASPTQCNLQLTTSVGAPRPAWVGDGFGASQAIFVMTPNFDYTSCGIACFGAGARSIANIQLWGTGLTAASNANCANGNNKVILAANNASSVIYGVDLGGICPGATGMSGVEVQNADETFDLGGAQSVGTHACYVHTNNAPGISIRGNDCRNDNVVGGDGLFIDGGQIVNSWSNTPLAGVNITGAGTKLISIGSTFRQGNDGYALHLLSGGAMASYSDVFTGGFLSVISGTTLTTTNTTYASGGQFPSMGGVVVSGGGNKLSGLPTNVAGAQWIGGGVLFGSCTGTATSSATLGLYGLGQWTTPTCTSTTTNAGISIQQVPLSGSAFALNCAATHAGVNASSGVITVLKNGSPTTLTCTIGTGTSCRDNTHFDIPAIGDVYSIQFTTQGSEVLAGVNCTLLSW